jgi:pyruvate/2-oxoglutarate/acetoin dehydrogenase E1 component
MNYFDELKRTMEWLAQQPKTIFVGQTVAGPGTFMYQTLRDLPPEKALEMPINESFQMQFTIGLALAGHVPVSVYPRQNFLLLATSDMVNMLDKIPEISQDRWPARVIIRVAVGPDSPVHPGHQHVGNYIESFKKMFSAIEVCELLEPEDIFPAYKQAYERADGKSTLLIEHGNFYSQK